MLPYDTIAATRINARPCLGRVRNNNNSNNSNKISNNINNSNDNSSNCCFLLNNGFLLFETAHARGAVREPSEAVIVPN